MCKLNYFIHLFIIILQEEEKPRTPAPIQHAPSRAKELKKIPEAPASKPDVHPQDSNPNNGEVTHTPNNVQEKPGLWYFYKDY